MDSMLNKLGLPLGKLLSGLAAYSLGRPLGCVDCLASQATPPPFACVTAGYVARLSVSFFSAG
jgi:hypothetical protein